MPRARLAAALVLLLHATADLQKDPVARVSAKVETAPVPSEKDGADDVTFWVDPARPELSLVIGTDKRSGLVVYDLAGKQRQYLADGRINNVDLRYGFPLGDREVALVVGGKRAPDVLVAYAVDPGARSLREVSARAIELGAEPHGCCMARSRTSGETYAFCTFEDGTVQQWRLFDDGTGKVDAQRVRTFDVGGQSEGCVADDENGWFFVSEEKVGIWRYGSEPTAGTERLLVDAVGQDGRLKDDVEGLALYQARDGGGYLLASSQGNDRFVAYERRAPHEYRLSFQIGASEALGIDEVTGTDGIDVVNLDLGSAFPAGIFAAQDDENPGGNQNFKLVDWREIAAAAKPQLTVDPSYDARGARPTPGGGVERPGGGG